MDMYYVYILKCADNTLYTGIAKDVQARLKSHNESKTGAKYTRARRPVRLMYSERKRNRSTAQKREAALKRLSRTEKFSLIATSSKPVSPAKSKKSRALRP